MPAPRVLLVGLADAATAADALRAAGCRVLVAATPDDAEGVPFDAAVAGGPDVEEWFASLRAAGAAAVLVSPSRVKHADLVAPDDLVAALLPRLPGAPSGRLKLGRREVDLGGHTVSTADGPVALTAYEVGLLHALWRANGAVVPRDVLLRDVWGFRAAVQTRAVENLVARLRPKLEDDPEDPRFLLTERGQGYRLVGARRVERTTATPLPPPPAPARLVGAEAVLAALRDAWARSRRVLLVGPPGVGKSAIAAVFAAEVGGFGYARGAVPEHDGPVLVDDLVDGDGDVAAHASFLGTRCAEPARTGSRWTDAIVVAVPPCSAEALAEIAARRAERLSIEPPDPGTIRALYERIGGLPLAAELLVDRLALLGADEVADRLRKDPLGLLANPSRRPAHHRSLREALERALGSLTPEDRAVLDALGAGLPLGDALDRVGEDGVLRALRTGFARRRQDAIEVLPALAAPPRGALRGG